MIAFKCDRCGNYFLDYTGRKSCTFYNVTTNPNVTGMCLDLCENCNAELQEWVNTFKTNKTKNEKKDADNN